MAAPAAPPLRQGLPLSAVAMEESAIVQMPSVLSAPMPAPASLPPIVISPSTVRAVLGPARRAASPRLAPLEFRSSHWVLLVQWIVDLLALQTSLALGFALRLATRSWWPITLSWREGAMLACAMFLVPVGYAMMDLYPGYGLGPVERMRRRLTVLGLLLGVLIVWYSFLLSFWIPGLTPSRGVLSATLLVAVVLCPLGDVLTRLLLTRAGRWGTPVAVLGAGKSGAEVVRTLRQNPELGLTPICLFDDNPNFWGRRIEGVPVVGPFARAKAYGGKARIALLSIPDLGRERLATLAARLPFSRVILVPDLVGLSTLGIHAHDLGGIVGLEVHKNLLRRHNLILKRILDYVLGVPLFLISLPILAVATAWIKIVSPGKVFYAQDRVGVGGKIIKVWKLRTMYPDAEARLVSHLAANAQARQEWDARFKLRNDPRILPGIGQVLRRTSLDELPQLWNVMCGQMSLVGPRPFPAYHLRRFRRDFRALRQSVLPGLTGLWQVSARSDGDLAAQETHDTYYIRNWSIWLDLHLLGRTVLAVLSCRGAY